MEKIKLGDISKLINGDRGKNYPSQADITKEGEIPFVNAGHLNGRNIDFGEMNYISREKYGKLSSGKFQRGDILYCLRGSLGKKAIVSNDIEGAIASSLVVIRPDREKVNGEYLMLALDSPAIKEQLVKANNGSSQPNLSAASVREYDIELPELSVQKEVVERLEKVKNVIDSRMQELQLLDELIKARFVEMFGNPETNSKGWTECALSEKLNVVGGYAFKSDKFDEISGIPVLRIGNINSGFFRPVNLVYWKEDENLERYTMYPGDLVMSLTGTVGKDDYGNVCILGDDYEMYYLNQRNAKLEIKEGIDKYYLSQLLKFEQIKKRLTGISRGVRQANISNKDILNLVVPVPPMELQEQFAGFVKQVDKLKVAVQKALDETQLLFDSLMQKYFG